jgi:hypothetical protein
MNITRRRILFIGLAVWVALASLTSCVSSDDAPAGARVEHPDPGAKAPPPPTAPTPANSESSAHTRPSSDVNEPPSGFALSPTDIDKALREDKPSRPWSKNVPERRCTKDDECGDGFCDRGRCAAIWTYSERYGQRCEDDGRCGSSYLCIDGRCRSCVSDEECTRTESWQSDPKCESVDKIPNARECFGVAGSMHRGVIIPRKGPGQ